MRCQNCSHPLIGQSYVVTKITEEGRDMTVNLCRVCLEYIVGSGPRHRLDNVLFNSRFITTRLPGF